MESDRKQVGRSPSSSSSFTNELFGSKDSSSSSSGIFGSMFAPPSQIIGRDPLGSDAGVKKQDSQPDAWSGRLENTTQGRESQGQSSGYKSLDSIFKAEKGQVQQPCHLSSSIYYGGQDIYSNSQGSQSSSSYKRDGEEEDPHTASRGNWWQGSLYY